MKFIDIFKKKTGNLAFACQMSFNGILSKLGLINKNGNYSQVYLNNCYVAIAIDKIADTSIEVMPYIKNIDENCFEKEIGQDLINFLKSPNSNQTYKDFIKSLITYYLLDGNVYILLIKDIVNINNITPQQLKIFQNKDVTITQYNNILTYRLTANLIYLDKIYTTLEFIPDIKIENNKVEVRYINKDTNWELLHIKEITFDGYNGISKLESITQELEQFDYINQSNTSFLKNASIPSGIFNISSEMTDEQKKQYEKILKQGTQGVQNAGQMTTLFSNMGTKIDYIPLSKTPTDMNYSAMISHIMQSIFLRYGLDLALFLNQSQKYNNMEQAKINFYKGVVLPLVQKIFEELQFLLFNKFEDFNNEEEINEYKLTYNEDDIAILKEYNKKMIMEDLKSGVLTLNEAREKLGLNPLASGGDVVYQPQNLVPIGTVIEKNTNIEEDIEDNKIEDENTQININEADLKEISMTLQNIKDSKGNKFFNL